MGEIKTAIEYEHLKKEEIFLKIRDIVIDKLEIQPEQVTCLANFNNDLGADSLEMLEIIIAMEEAFKVEIPDVEAEKLVMVQQAVDYISQIAT
ncbi:MAG: acyl carrier protein [Chroococcidiopsidaceae cyanobacterium CP_BM_ER_R8_30]|nr:acyl carrier protein [Chroococcidiopsidaceae cyanobacterium CP_BM_ER_R8_30]